MSPNLIFAKHCFTISLNEEIVFSPDIKHILRITHNEENHLSKLLIYKLDCSVTADNNNVHLIYQKRYNYPAKIKFSGDGNQLLINNNDIIDILVFDKSGIHEESTLLLSELYKISNSFKKDFIPQHVECVELRETYITLCIDHNWLLAFQMQKNLVFSLRYCMNLINDVKYLHSTMDKVHCLTGHGKIFSYNLFDGSIWRMFDIYSILPDNVHCDKFLMNNNNHQIALYNNEMIFIFDIFLVNQQYYELADNTSLYKSSGQSDSGSVKSFMTNVSSTSAYSRSDSVHALKLSKSKNKMSTNKTPLSWISYLNNLSICHNVENSESESCNSNPFICISDLPENSSIVNILFYSSNSVGIWFVSDEKRADNYYSVYDCNTGQNESSQILPPDTRVVSLNHSRIHLDVFVNTCHLSLPLVNTNEEALINKLLNCIGSDCVAWLLQLNKSLSQSMQPLSLLKDALRNSQTHLIKLSIDLQIQELKRDITKTSVNVVKLKDSTEMIMDEMIASIKDENIKESFKKQILVEAISYANKILTLLDSVLKEDFPLLDYLKIEILKRVVLLRSDLQKPQLLPKEEPIQISQWPMWELLSEKEVLKDGIKELPLVHCFLIIRRHWTSKDVIGERFKKLVFSIAIEYLEKQILDEAKQILIQTGYDPEEELLLICKTTFNRSLRDYLINSLTDIGKDIIKAWTFVKLVDGILDSYSDQRKETEDSVALNAKFSISDILNYSSESKTQILTDLYFNTQDSTLLKFLEKNICWDYLLSYNKIEGLLMWIDCTLSDHKPENSSLWPINLFSEWKISQDMVDRVLTSNISDFTKDNVFYELARYGIFNSVEKNDPKAIMQRLAVCKLAINYEEVLSKPTSVLSCEEFEEMTLKHAVEHDMVDIAITAPQDLVLKTNVTHPNWFCLWKSFCEVSNNWTDEGVLKLITETSEYLAEGDISTYLREHPYVAVATDLIQKKEISRVHAHLSPIIAAIVDLESPPEGVTMYSLLSGTVPFYTDNLFLFQANQNRPDKASNIQMPDFTNEELSEKYGHKQSLKYIDRLKHGRPCQAVTDLYNKNKKLTPQIKRNACISVHGYALYHIDDLIVSASSIAFIEMLGNDSQLLRTHIACAAIIQKNKNYNEENLKSLLYKVVTNTKGAAEEFLREVENALYEQWKDESDTFQCLQQNQLPVLLASLHGLPPPYIALKYAATSNNWLLFILTAQIFKYPVDK
uniref:Spatacsin C-terminal domain-containing protein n=2 Tax=Clastoptera arizonana TaxID=38151 RepID=A0A1B6CYX8_9HEMI